MSLVVKSTQDPAALANAVRGAVASVDRDEPITAVQTLNEVIEQYFGQQRLTLTLIGAFASLALLLALVGLHGIMAYSVAQRTQELGIRRALGASSEDIRSLVLGQALRLTGAGIVLGIAGSLALTRLISGLLYGVKPTDPAVFAATAILFTLVALGASYLPASRAAKVDPAVALRYE
jgi:ABC-type antimicrobial peptide transport system permease subunit